MVERLVPDDRSPGRYPGADRPRTSFDLGGLSLPAGRPEQLGILLKSSSHVRVIRTERVSALPGLRQRFERVAKGTAE